MDVIGKDGKYYSKRLHCYGERGLRAGLRFLDRLGALDRVILSSGDRDYFIYYR